jgi:hypothetical protein
LGLSAPESDKVAKLADGTDAPADASSVDLSHLKDALSGFTACADQFKIDLQKFSTDLESKIKSCMPEAGSVETPASGAPAPASDDGVDSEDESTVGSGAAIKIPTDGKSGFDFSAFQDHIKQIKK